MLAIYKKEIKSLFNNVVGWLFVGITLALFGLYFFVYNLSYGYPYVSYSLSAISFMFMFTVPVLTMRTIAEEKKTKTDQLLFTSPVPMWKIVFGKFLAFVTVYSICIAIICVSPIVLSVFGEIPMLETYVAIFGFWLYGVCCIAIGVFASSLTENQVISAVIAFVFLFLGYMMSSLCGAILPSEGILAKVLSCYDLYSPMEQLLNGSFQLSAVLYYVSVTFLALFFAYEVLQKRRWNISNQKISASVFSVSTIVLCVVLVVLINFGVSKIPTKYTEFDVTSKKLYSITEETKDYISKLKDDITIYVYVDPKVKDENVDKTLKKYDQGSKHIKVEYINPSENPTFTEKYTENTVNPNSILVVCGDRCKVIDYGSSENSYADSQIYEYTMDPTTYSYVPSGYDLEGQVTSAIAYVTSESSAVVYTLGGHEESPFTKSFTEIFEKQFIEVKTLDLLQENKVPDDCEVLYINGPKSDLSNDDLDKIKSYINKGGSVVATIDFSNFDKQERWRAFLNEYHVATTDSFVEEHNKSYYYQEPSFLLPMVEETEMTSGISGTSSVFSPYTIGLNYTGNSDDCLILMSSSDDCAAADTAGPFSYGLMVSNDKGGNLVVVGSSYVFTEGANDMVAGRNAKLFHGILNGVISVADDNNAAIVIPSKDYSVASLMVSERMILVYGILWGIFMPLLSIVVGIIIWAKRRKL